MQVKLTFNNGVVMNAENTLMRKEYVQNANREVIEFQFAVETDYATQASALNDLAFNADAMRKITSEAVETKSIAIYNDYSIPLGINTKLIDATDDKGNVVSQEKRICVTMAQQFQSEVEQAQLRETVDMLVLSSLGGK